jgi:osmotically-inducible protein OsmY
MNNLPDLSQRVTAALEFERRINLHRFPIRVRPGAGTLVLEGHVEDVAAKRIAARIASELAGGESLVVDALDVVPAVTRPDGDMLDAFTRTLLDSPELRPFTIRRRHRDELQTLRTAPEEGAPCEIEFGVREGVIELAGSVPSLSHRRVVEALAWWLGGCRNVINRLRVDPPENDGDDELADAVKLVLEIDPSLPESQPIGVDATRGVVTLSGGVQEDAQRRRAEQDTWCVEGVREVRNTIEVSS